MILVQTLLITRVLHLMRWMFSALNEPQKIGLTTEKKTGSRRTEKRKRAVPLKWKGKKNCYEIQDLHTETLREVLKYLNGRYAFLVGLLVDWNVFLSSPSEKYVISKDIGLWEVSMPKNSEFVLVSHQARLESLWTCFIKCN